MPFPKRGVHCSLPRCARGETPSPHGNFSANCVPRPTPDALARCSRWTAEGGRPYVSFLRLLEPRRNKKTRGNRYGVFRESYEQIPNLKRFYQARASLVTGKRADNAAD
jgi:hypothetical protein